MAVAAGGLREAPKIRPVGPRVLAFVGDLGAARQQAEPIVRPWMGRSSPVTC